MNRSLLLALACPMMFLVLTPNVSLAAGDSLSALAEPAFPADKDPCLVYLPSDWWLVGNVNIKAISDFLNETYSDQNGQAQLAIVQQYMNVIKAITGIDPMREVDFCTFFLAGQVSHKPGFLAVVQGSFDRDTVAQAMGEHIGSNMTSLSYAGTTIYHSDSGFGYCLVDGPRLLFGDVKLIKQALDAGQAKDKALPPALQKTLRMTDARSAVWAACRPRAILGDSAFDEWSAHHTEFTRRMNMMDCVSVFFEVTKTGLLTHAIGYAGNPDKARQLHGYLAQTKRSLLHEQGVNVFFASFLVMSELQQGGPYVEGTFKLTTDSLKQLWNTMLILKPMAVMPKIGGASAKK